MTSRWFTDTAASGPAPAHFSVTPVEDEALADILNFARTPGNEERELMIALTSDGTKRLDASTGRKEAGLTDRMRDAILGQEGVRLWHNHPSQGSLSHGDWWAASTSSDLEVLAVTTRGSIFVGRVVDYRDEFQALFQWLPRLAGDLELHIDNRAKLSGSKDEDIITLPRFVGHVLNLALADACGVRYAYRFMPEEGTVVARLAAVLDEGRSFANAAIGAWLAKSLRSV
jgi:hypothetical protein